MSDLHDAVVLEDLCAVVDRSAGPRDVLLLVIVGFDLFFAQVHRIADGVAVEHVADFRSSPETGQAAGNDPVNAVPAEHPASRTAEGLHFHIVARSEFRGLHQVAPEGWRDDGEHVVFVFDFDIVVAENRLRTENGSKRSRAGTVVLGGVGEFGKQGQIDVTVDDSNGFRRPKLSLIEPFQINLNFLNIGYRFNESWGLTANLGSSGHAIENYDIAVGVGVFSFGPMYTVSLSESISWDLKPQYAASMKGVYSGDDVTALGLKDIELSGNGFMFGNSLVFGDGSKGFDFSIDLDYLMGKFTEQSGGPVGRRDLDENNSFNSFKIGVGVRYNF